MRSFAKIKPSRKFPNLQYSCCFDWAFDFNIEASVIREESYGWVSVAYDAIYVNKVE